MRISEFRSWLGSGNAGIAAFVAVLTLVTVSVVVGAFRHRANDTVLVLATQTDCLRAFDEEKCRAIVAAAMKIHAQSAPRFMSRQSCELAFGAGRCRAVDASMPPPISMFAPDVAVVLAARGGATKDLLPLYFGASREAAARDGQRVYFRGAAVGRFMEVRFGGAELSRVVDLSGKPISPDRLAKLRGR